MSQCAKPACNGPGGVVLGYDYAAGVVVLEDRPEGLISPHLYVLCLVHAERLTIPFGWTLEDKRQSAQLAAEVSTLPTLEERERISLHDDLSASGGQIFFGSGV